MFNIRKPAFSAKKILLPVDFSRSSEAALEAASGLAQQFHAGIHLVHIIPEIPDVKGADFFAETAVLQERKETIEEKLDAFRQRLTQQGVPASFSIETGNDIVGSLMRVIQREQTDLLVISTHGVSGWHPFIFGSIAEHMIKQVSCTLLLLQSDQAGLAAAEAPSGIPESSFIPSLPETKRVATAAHAPDTDSERRLDRAADELAQRGARTEQRYDQDHSLFTK